MICETICRKVTRRMYMRMQAMYRLQWATMWKLCIYLLASVLGCDFHLSLICSLFARVISLNPPNSFFVISGFWPFNITLHWHLVNTFIICIFHFYPQWFIHHGIFPILSQVIQKVIWQVIFLQLPHIVGNYEIKDI